VTVSFGSVTSLISLPCYMSHASIPADVRAARGLPDDLVRISVGIESVDDLLADLDRAMCKAMDKVGMAQVPVAVAAGNTSPAEAQLLTRVRQLEEQIKSLTASVNGSATGGDIHLLPYRSGPSP
jgi:cystathionine beta-lyase